MKIAANAMASTSSDGRLRKPMAITPISACTMMAILPQTTVLPVMKPANQARRVRGVGAERPTISQKIAAIAAK